MATRYVRSLAAGAADGTTWADAYTTLAAAATASTAGDDIYVADDHSESTAAVVALTFAGTPANPVRVVGANDTAAPPTSVADTAVVEATGANNLNVNGSAFVRGIEFIANGGTAGGILLNGIAPNSQEYQSCTFRLTATLNRFISIGSASTAPYKTIWRDCDVAFNGTGQRIRPVGYWQWDGGTFLSGTTPVALVTLNGNTGRAPENLIVSGVDLSAAGAGMHLFDTGNLGIPGFKGIFRNCKLPASWSGSLVSTAISAPGVRCEMYNCDSGDTNYAIQIVTYEGSLVQETVIVRTGGAGNDSGLTDGASALAALAWKCVTSANARYPQVTLDLPEIVRWNETTGSAITATVEIITDNVTLTDAECWLEVQYLGAAGVPLGVFASDAKADVLATAANQTTSSETWTTTGLTTPVRQKLAVTFTPQEKGYIHAVVKLAKASTTVYVDPLLTVT